MEMGYGTGKIRSRTFGAGSHIGKRKYSDEERFVLKDLEAENINFHTINDSYFENDDDNQDLYQSAEGSPSAKTKEDGSDSDDALDAFMQSIEVFIIFPPRLQICTRKL